MIKVGYQVVYKSGKDKSIYNVHHIENDLCTISTYTSGTKVVSLDSIREADDVEIMIGYKVN